MSVKKTKKRSPKRKPPKPIFPWVWIARRIGYAGFNFDDPYSPNFSASFFSDPEDIRFVVVPFEDYADIRLELPDDTSREFYDLLKQLSLRGVDPNYVRAVIWYCFDPDRRVDIKVYSKDEKKKLSDEACEAFIKSCEQVKPYMDTGDYEQIKGLMEKYQMDSVTKQLWEDSDVISSASILPKKKEKRPGKPSDFYMDLTLVLLVRHLEKYLIRKGGEKGPYLYTAEILNMVYPVTFKKKLDRKRIVDRLAYLKKKKNYLKASKIFEDKFIDITDSFVKRASENNIPLPDDRFWESRFRQKEQLKKINSRTKSK